MQYQYLEYPILIIGTFIITWIITYLLRKALDFFIKRNSEQLNMDPTNFIFLKNSISFLVYGIGVFWIFTKVPYFKTLGTALFASAGVFAAILGFASQKAFANIIGGIFILIFKPFRVGDVIEIPSGLKGVIEEITLRHTVIKDYEAKRIVIPNSIISEETIINSSIKDKRIRKYIDISIAYESDLELAENLILEEIKNHPFYIYTRTAEEKESGLTAVPMKVISLGDFSITIRSFVWTMDFDKSIDLQRDVFRSIKLVFDKNGIEIPYPHRTIVFKTSPKEMLNEI